jgi:hypothetical protein
MVTIEVLFETQVPPLGDELNVLVVPMPMFARPVMAAGIALTVTGNVAEQPVDTIYVMVAVPGATPITQGAVTVATEGFELVHIPPGIVGVIYAVKPGHVETGPDVDGVGLTVTALVLTQPIP